MNPFFGVGYFLVCLNGTVWPVSCIHHVVVQAPHDRRSHPVPYHGCEYHKSTQSRGISASARTTVVIYCLSESLLNVHIVFYCVFSCGTVPPRKSHRSPGPFLVVSSYTIWTHGHNPPNTSCGSLPSAQLGAGICQARHLWMCISHGRSRFTTSCYLFRDNSSVYVLAVRVRSPFYVLPQQQ